jgi:hypothetical protein
MSRFTGCVRYANFDLVDMYILVGQGMATSSATPIGMGFVNDVVDDVVEEEEVDRGRGRGRGRGIGMI